MPRTIAPNEVPPPPDAAPNRIRWTVQQCDAIREAGVLTSPVLAAEVEQIHRGNRVNSSLVILVLDESVALVLPGDLTRRQLAVLDFTERLKNRLNILLG